MLKDLAFLWITSMLHICIAWNWPASFTCELIWTNPAFSQDNLLRSAIHVVFCLRNRIYFLLACWCGRCCSLIGVFGVIVLFKNTLRWHFFFGILQHDPLKYFYVFRLIHYLWYGKNRPSTTVRETPQIMMHMGPHSMVFTLHCGFNSVFEGHPTNWGP